MNGMNWTNGAQHSSGFYNNRLNYFWPIEKCNWEIISIFLQSSTTWDESQRSLSVFIAQVLNSYLPLKLLHSEADRTSASLCRPAPRVALLAQKSILNLLQLFRFISGIFFITWKFCFKPSFSLYLMYTVSVCKLYFVSQFQVCRNIFLIFLGKNISCFLLQMRGYLSRNKIIANYYHYCLILIAVQAWNDCDENNQAVVCTDVMFLKSVF